MAKNVQATTTPIQGKPRGRDARVLGPNGRVEHRAVIGMPGWAIVLLRMLSDALVVLCAFWLAWWLRYTVEIGGPVAESAEQPFSYFYTVVAILIVLVVGLLQVRGGYRLPRWTTMLDEAFLVVGAVNLAMTIVILYAFVQRFSPSRLVFLYAWLLIIVLLVSKRIVLRHLRARLWRRGIGLDRVLVVGAGQAGQRVLQWLHGQPQLGYEVVGVIDDVPPPPGWGIATERRVVYPPHLGTCEDIGEIVRTRRIDEVIIALPPTAHRQMAAIVDQCRAQDVEFKLVPDLFELTMDSVHIHDVAGLPMIALRPARITGLDYAVKRTMDIVVAALVLTVLAPLLLLVALLIKLDSPGSVLYRQERVGKNGRRFICYKFRSMYEGADRQKAALAVTENVDPRRIKIPDDPRRTRVGKIIRPTSIDELPQFINVLLGDMSVVGPRPQVPDEVARYDDWHYARLQVTPGLTGLWQVSGRSDLTFDEMVRLDLYYAEHWSPLLDLKIILRTVPAVLTSRGAY